MKAKTVIFLFTLFWFINLNAQETKHLERKLFNSAEFFVMEEEYEKAIKYYEELFQLDTTNRNVAYKLGECYFKEKYYFKAIKYLNIAAQSMVDNYNEDSHKETNASYLTLLLLGKSYLIVQEFDKAEEHFITFSNVVDIEDKNILDMIDNQLRICDVAANLVSFPVNVDIENIGNTINTIGSEFNPLVSADDKLMVFARKVYVQKEIDDESLKFQYSIFIAENIDGVWYEYDELTDRIESDGHFIPVSLSADGKKLVLFRDNYNFGSVEAIDQGALYYAENIDGEWNKIEKFNLNINSFKWESSGSFSDDGNAFYFSSNRDGGLGGMDIYVSYKKNGNWGVAQNVGGVINTSLNEEYPYVIADSIMFFSSEKHENIGGYDFFISHKIDGEWTEPKNLGFPINTSDDNKGLSPCLHGTKAYFSSLRPDGYRTFGNSDLYYVIIKSK